MMKQLIFMASFTLLAALPGLHAQKKEFREMIKKEIAFSNQSDHTLIVKNVFGDITVEGYAGAQVVVEVEKIISAKNQADLDLGKKELNLGVIEKTGQVILYPDAPYADFDGENLKFNWCNNHDEPSYGHILNFKIKVPNKIHVNVSTVNDGEVTVKNTRGEVVSAENINGGITLTDITGTTKVHCINGDVNISYATNPKNASTYYSLNGDITIAYQRALSASISFKSMNGELYTDFDVNKQFMKTDKTMEKGNKPKYRFEAKPVVQIGSGLVDHDFETLNGNVFIKKI
ncbi:MAG: DUF4097 family beta strand repeat-containing protein [Allomuricauda sp.]